jgi:sterol desaturase/sphingolipid hydroxylase (fatty acid hydroxylase superfamily)
VVNISITALVFIIVSIFISPLAKSIIHLTSNHGYGLLSLLPVNPILLFVTGFLLMDLTFYYWHRLNHELPLLWRFHNVHHVDPDLDVTTSMRFHVVEIAYSSLFRLFQLFLIGIDPLTFLCYEFVFQVSTFFHHSNIKLPIRLERLLNKVIVTPRMHGIHHSNYRDETNSNYSVVFSFWDKLHRTIKLNVPQQSVTIGVPGYEQVQDNTFKNLLLMPFKPQRPYWQTNQLARKVPVENKDSGFLSV